ncbi:Cys-tRNA(Pro) deacylase [uncultured Microscilla sp.]|uniref:Cys-tRNA(Pro) deacylase n=1 Tax=uncultured Microscilla sp. TaxID=432653 RepID=UPI00262CB126|nr:Cys-tRNA(Pro) deacylase [uncultured Microscilla sp.]
MATKKTNALRLLDKHKAAYKTITYEYDPENLDVAKIAADNQLELTSIYKTLVVKGDKTGVWVAVVPGNKNLSLKAMAQASNNKKVAMVPVKEIQGLTGYIRGGCSPLGMKKDYPVVIDTNAQVLPTIFVNAGQRGILVGVSPNDLQKITGAAWAAISE